MMSDYNEEKVLLCEDMTLEQAKGLRTMINQMTDEIGLCYGEKKGASRFAFSIDKFIVTSNDEPPTEDTWHGFTRRFTIIYCH